MTPSESVTRMWHDYLRSIHQDTQSAPPPACCQFSDNPAEVDALAQLVLDGVKRATAPSVWELEAIGEPLPAVGDLQVVTDWAGEAVCVIRTVATEIVPYCDVSAAFAAREGEGDRSLRFWREAHWGYYTRVLAPFGKAPTDDMPIVCEDFERVFPA